MKSVLMLATLFLLLIPAKAEIKIVSTVKPLADIVKEIGREMVEVDYIIPPSANFHTYEIKTTDIRKINDSHLFIYLGYGEPNITGIVNNLPKNKTFQITKIPGLSLITEEDHDEIHPGLWLDPENGKIIARFIYDYLSKKDPKNTQFYKQNYTKFVEEINNLIIYGKDKLSSLKNKNFVSYHYEFPYFVNRFGLVYLAEIEMGHGREPTPKHLYHVIQKIKSNNVKTVFTSKQFYNKKVMDMIVSKTGVKVVFLDSQGENSSYLKMIKYNIDKVYEELSR